MTVIKTRSVLWAFVIAYAFCFAIQSAGAYFTAESAMAWYPTLVKSPFNPPRMAFPIAWTTLYFLMAFAAARIAVRTGWASRPMQWWFVQLVLGLGWSIVFFGNHSPAGGLAVIIAMLLAVVFTTVHFWRIDRFAGWLMLPLLVWLTLATHLNLFIYLHN